MVDFIVDHHHKGQAEGGSMKKEQWLALSRAVGEMTPAQCKNKWGDFKLKYRQWKELEQQSGFGWNEERQLYEAENDVWTNLNKSWKNIVWHKTHILQHREQLETVLTGSQATGNHAISAWNAITPEPADPEDFHNNPRKETGATKRKAAPSESAREAKKPKAATAAEAMARMTDLIENAVKEQQQGKLTKSERAVELAQSLYQGRISVDDMTEVFELLENETKAGIFLAIKDETQRDNWLMKKTNMIILDTTEARRGREDAANRMEEEDLLIE